jgi:hypothetical protein
MNPREIRLTEILRKHGVRTAYLFGSQQEAGSDFLQGRESSMKKRIWMSESSSSGRLNTCSNIRAPAAASPRAGRGHGGVSVPLRFPLPPTSGNGCWRFLDLIRPSGPRSSSLFRETRSNVTDRTAPPLKRRDEARLERENQVIKRQQPLTLSPYFMRASSASAAI